VSGAKKAGESRVDACVALVNPYPAPVYCTKLSSKLGLKRQIPLSSVPFYGYLKDTLLGARPWVDREFIP
jgi:hypothetical protein